VATLPARRRCRMNWADLWKVSIMGVYPRIGVYGLLSISGFKHDRHSSLLCIGGQSASVEEDGLSVGARNRDVTRRAPDPVEYLWPGRGLIMNCSYRWAVAAREFTSHLHYVWATKPITHVTRIEEMRRALQEIAHICRAVLYICDFENSSARVLQRLKQSTSRQAVADSTTLRAIRSSLCAVALQASRGELPEKAKDRCSGLTPYWGHCRSPYTMERRARKFAVTACRAREAKVRGTAGDGAGRRWLS
jgi:hypothetical protein